MARGKKANKRPAEAVRQARRVSGPDPVVRYREQRRKLLANIEAVRTLPTMHGERWREGQLRHFEKLLTQLEASKPEGA